MQVVPRGLNNLLERIFGCNRPRDDEKTVAQPPYKSKFFSSNCELTLTKSTVPNEAQPNRGVSFAPNAVIQLITPSKKEAYKSNFTHKDEKDANSSPTPVPPRQNGLRSTREYIEKATPSLMEFASNLLENIPSQQETDPEKIHKLLTAHINSYEPKKLDFGDISLHELWALCHILATKLVKKYLSIHNVLLEDKEKSTLMYKVGDDLNSKVKPFTKAYAQREKELAYLSRPINDDDLYS
ncbi:MAG: hypothetical protein V4591_07735 [Bdellovibrionota bacterium]